MGIDELREHIAKAKEAATADQLLWNANRDAWLRELTKVYDQIEGWLEPLKADGTIHVARENVNISEEYIGQYDAPLLSIKAMGKHIQLKPVGTSIIGAYGRIDILAGGMDSRIKMVLVHKDSGGPHVRMEVIDLPDTREKQASPPRINFLTEKPDELVWKIPGNSRPLRYHPLTEELFTEILLELLKS